MSLNSVSIVRNLIFSEGHDILIKKVMKIEVVKNQPFLEILQYGAIKSKKQAGAELGQAQQQLA